MRRKNKKIFPNNVLKVYLLCRRIDTLFDLCQRRWKEVNKIDKENDELRKENYELKTSNKSLLNLFKNHDNY